MRVQDNLCHRLFSVVVERDRLIENLRQEAKRFCLKLRGIFLGLASFDLGAVRNACCRKDFIEPQLLHLILIRDESPSHRYNPPLELRPPIDRNNEDTTILKNIKDATQARQGLVSWTGLPAKRDTLRRLQLLILPNVLRPLLFHLPRSFESNAGEWQAHQVKVRLPQFVRIDEIAAIRQNELHALLQHHNDAANHIRRCWGAISDGCFGFTQILYCMRAVIQRLDYVIVQFDALGMV